MDVEITLKNYRCFPDSSPARIRVRNGFIALVGPNNVGKSSLLRFFVEFRPLFDQLKNGSSLFITALKGQNNSTPLASVIDPQEIFSNTNSRDLSIEFKFQWDESNPAPRELRIIVKRSNRVCLVEFVGFPSGPDASISNSVLFANGRQVPLVHVFEAFGALTRTLYVGPFRNAINVGTNQNYFDIKVGTSFIEQ